MQSNNNGSSNQNWTISFFGLDATNTIGMGNIEAPEGYYLAEIKNVAQSDVNRPDTIYFDCVVADGEFKGAKMSKGIRLPEKAAIFDQQLGQTKNAFIWTSLFRSLGYQVNQIGQPTFQVQPSSWVGQIVPVMWRPSNKDLGVYSEMLFIERHVWEQRKAIFDKQNPI